jgi:hypothetical protein
MEGASMTTVEQISLANEKVEHWRGKCERAASMLSKWESRLKGLQGKSPPTSKKLPPVTLVPGTEHVMPRGAIKTAGDVAAAEHLARETALHDIAEAEAADAKVVPIVKDKAKAAKAKPKKR